MTERFEFSKNIVCLLFNHPPIGHVLNLLCARDLKDSVYELVFGSLIIRILSLLNKTVITLRPQLLTLALMGGGEGVESPLRFFEDSENAQRRRSLHTISAILSTPFLKILSPVHLRSGYQIRSSDPTS